MTSTLKIKEKLTISCLATLSLLFFFNIDNAQKLPNKQLTCIWSPTDIKIDGKPDEWKGSFQAYNHATDLFYTISNNNDFFYLIIQAQDYKIARKIIGTGVTLTLRNGDLTKAYKNVGVTFPVFEKGNKFFPSFYKSEDIPKSKRKEILDSIVMVDNLKMDAKSKLISISGFEGLDTLISRYNDVGFKCRALFDNNRFYTCEMAIPLQRLRNSIEFKEKLWYNIRINGSVMSGITINRDPTGKIRSMHFSADGQLDQAATDFSGEYTLAKAP